MKTTAKTAWFRSFYVSLISVVGFALLVVVCAQMIKGASSDNAGGEMRTLAGDADCNGEVALPDGVLIAKSSAGRGQLSVTGKMNADIDLDGSVTARDLSFVLKFLSGEVLTLEPEDVFSDLTTTETTSTTTSTTTTTSSTTTTTSTTTSTTTTTTTTTTSTTTTTTTTSTTTTTTTATTTTTTTQAPLGEALIVEDKKLPLGLGSGNLIAEIGSPTEELVVGYEDADMKFYIYNQDPAHLHIAIGANDIIVGYYAVGTLYEAPEGYTTTAYVDEFTAVKGTLPAGTGEVFALLSMKKGYTINMRKIRDKSNLEIMAKLNWYGVNALRALNDLPPLNYNPVLVGTALAHSQDMAANQYFDHASQDGTTPGERIKATGLKTNLRGENIDLGYTDPFWALSGWYISEQGHRDNLLSENYTDMGVGFAYCEATNKFYGTQDFARVTG